MIGWSSVSPHFLSFVIFGISMAYWGLGCFLISHCIALRCTALHYSNWMTCGWAGMEWEEREA